ncbi:MAG TPA: class I SAM-dependent methyltransferase [Azospirillum sp.]|nr:class I SAM-dependent methyltransferase [Azospirillum sp.]
MIDDERIIRHISDRDAMYAGHEPHYFGVGKSALAAIEAARTLSGQPAPGRILDLPCGHGRVTRVLRAAWPEAEITACDIDQHGVDFCRDTFGCVPVHGRPDFEAVTFPHPFDLIWVGSLLTHLPEARSRAFLAYAAGLLGEGGTLVVTLHGRFVAGRLRGGTYGIPDEAVGGMLQAFEGQGYGYADYPGHEGYGISITRPGWVVDRAAELGLSITLLSERCWDRHHDVAAVRRSEP